MKSTIDDHGRLTPLGPGDLTLRAYRRLRPGRATWQRITAAFVGPAVRLHRLRNTATRLWRDAICDLDCGGERGETS